MTLQTFILASYSRIGDEVVMQMDPESRAWGSKEQTPDGTKGIIVGYHRYDTYRERNHGMYGAKPGKYTGNGAIIVQWETGKAETVSAHAIAPIDQSVLEERKKDKKYREAFDHLCFVEDLPDTTYYEGDIVQLNEDFFEDGGQVKILSIDYYRWNTFCNDGVTPFPCYRVESVKGNRGSTSIREADVAEIVKRGPIWNHYHNLPLVFDTVIDQVKFYRQIGKVQQVKNPRTDNYQWSIADIVQAMENKQIALMGTSGSVFGSTPFPTAYIIPEYPELEELARREFKLEEFQEKLRNGELT